MQKKSLINKKLICLGTAKFDNRNYGFTNSRKFFEVEEILGNAFKYGINSIDSSPRYHGSEKLIGKFLKKNTQDIFISSKIDGLEPKSENSIDKIIKSVKKSIKNLNIEKLNLCFLHQNEIEIISDKYIKKGLKLLKEHELVDEIGSSIYSLDELDFTIESEIYDWVQIPMNITDTYFYNHILKKKSNIKIAARSIFLQGILFQNENRIKRNLKLSNDLISYIKNFKNKLRITNKEFKLIAISYLNYLSEINMIIIGSSSPRHLKFFIDSINKPIDNSVIDTINDLSKNQKKWSNPRNW